MGYSRSDLLSEALDVSGRPDLCYRDGTAVQLCAEAYIPHRSTRFLNWAADAAERLPELYAKREDCCGCTACVVSCPAHAISMLSDEEGFLYPVVDAAACVGCGKCRTVCPLKG